MPKRKDGTAWSAFEFDWIGEAAWPACALTPWPSVKTDGARRQRYAPPQPVLSGGGLFRVPEAIKIGRPPATIPSPFPTSSHPIPPPHVDAFLPALLHPHLLAPRHALALMAEADL